IGPRGPPRFGFLRSFILEFAVFMRRRVVVTGIGMINPMGHDVSTVWEGLREGKSGVGPTTLFDASGFPTKISAEVKNWDITDTGESAEVWKDRGRHTKF